MKIHLLAIGKPMPSWIKLGFEEYTKRLPLDYQVSLIELSAIKRTKNMSSSQAIRLEGELMLRAIPKNSKLIALDMKGKPWDTPTLAKNLKSWHDDQCDITLMIGGADGLAPFCLEKAELKLSLSNLTLPHLLVRVLVVEQIYRAWSIITGHPYHR